MDEDKGLDAPFILVTGDGPLVAPVLDLLAGDPRLHAILPLTSSSPAHGNGHPKVEPPLNPRNFEEMVARFRRHADLPAVVVGAFSKTILIPAEAAGHYFVNKRRLGIYEVLQAALDIAKLKTVRLGVLLPHHRIRPGEGGGRPLTQPERDRIREVRIAARSLVNNTTMIVFRPKGEVQRHRGDPIEKLRTLPPSATRGASLFLRGAAPTDGLAGWPILQPELFEVAAAARIRHIYIETCRIPVLLGTGPPKRGGCLRRDRQLGDGRVDVYALRWRR